MDTPEIDRHTPCCGHREGDRHDWNCTLTPIYAQLWWDTDDVPPVRRSEGFRNPETEWNLIGIPQETR